VETSSREPSLEELIRAVESHFEPQLVDLPQRPLREAPNLSEGPEDQPLAPRTDDLATPDPDLEPVDPDLAQAGDPDPALLQYYPDPDDGELDVPSIPPPPVDPTPETPAAPPHLCQTDPLSIRRLRRLAADDPSGWRERLRTHLPDHVRHDIEAGYASAEATLRQVLLAHCPQLVPPLASSIGVETVRRARQLLSVVLEHDGELASCEAVTNDALHMLRTHAVALERADGRGGLSPESASRAMSLVRAALDGWLEARGESLLDPAPPAAPAPPRPPQRTALLRRVWKLLRDSSPAERIKIGLAVGAGLREPEIEALRTGDLAVREVPPKVAVRLGLLPGVSLLFVSVRGLSDPAQVRWTPLPPWVAELILVARPRLGAEGEQGGPLVPVGRAPSLSASLRRLQKDVRGEGGHRITPSDLRRTYQAIARRGGCSREVVRGTWSQREDRAWPKRWHRAQAHLWRLAASWGDFSGGVASGFVDHVDLVPRRARPGCRAAGLEIAPKRSKRRNSGPLPSRVRELPPAPDKAK
jgi:integrase